MAVLTNILLFQFGWFSCVLGAARHLPWVGTLVSVGIIAWHLSRSALPRREAALILLAGAIGLLLDSVVVHRGLIAYTSGTLAAGLAPHWIVAMWMIFATTLNVSFRWLKGRWLLAAALGAAAGPLAYLGGARLGAAEFPGGGVAPLLAIAAVWAIAMPLLLWLSDRYDGVTTTVDR